MNFISLISLSAALLVFVASPGPGVFATVARSVVSGFKPALAVILGIVVGDTIYLMFAIFGLSVVAQAMGDFFIILKICGGAYLFWLGFKIWFSKPSTVDSKQLHKNYSHSGNFMSGLFITLSNPKVILFYCGFLPAFIDLSILTVVDVSMIVAVVTIVLSSVLMAYAYLASHTRQLFSSQIALKRLNRSAGAVMIATGIVIATK